MPELNDVLAFDGILNQDPSLISARLFVQEVDDSLLRRVENSDVGALSPGVEGRNGKTVRVGESALRADSQHADRAVATSLGASPVLGIDVENVIS